MASIPENVRFFLLSAALLVCSAALCVYAVLLHAGRVDVTASRPRYVVEYGIQPRRGAIYSAVGRGYPMACSVPEWVYHVDPKAVPPKALERTIGNTAATFGMSEDAVRAIYARTDSRFVPLAVSTSDKAHNILSNPKYAAGIVIEKRYTRTYPQGKTLSHVLGFVSKDPLKPVGAAGLEQRWERDLRGQPGSVTDLRDARRRELYSEDRVLEPPRHGADVYLTVDHNLQFEVENALAGSMRTNGAEAAWCVILNAKTGAILAMASLPDFSPADYNRSGPEAKKNRAISENYEPGSVMKTITACAVLNEGMVSPETMIDTRQHDPAYFRLPGDHGHKWEPFMSVREALVHSSNIVYGKLGFRLGPRKLWEYMRAFGFGRKVRLGLPGEESGLLPNWKSWDKVKWSRAPIGQGVAVTAIQLASAYAAIANDGVQMEPYLVDRVSFADPETGEETCVYRHEPKVLGTPIRPATARMVREMMLGVAKKGGTARRAAVKGYSVAGKTGTAQMKEGKGYSDTRYNASFVGIIPASAPEVVVLVTFQAPTYCRSFEKSKATGIPLYNHQGGVCAAPAFSRIAAITMRYLAVPPDKTDELEDD